ncbi:hypothetical protein C7C45_01130 [Micromonospora arborensis]|uniref:Fibronectin type-III domain-containing protein n=2 Tax=Micromonospora arborensis TaxID=2116518 RepID=A0A318NWF4_9ACTN|nr:hypothetical protein C7C45_01130 [Micromonospora arborensis]
MTAPPWSLNAPPQPLAAPGADSAELPPVDAVGAGVDDQLGLGGADAGVVPTRQAGVAPSDQTVVFPAVQPDSGPPRGDTSPSQPIAAQPVPTAAQPDTLTAPPSPTAAQPNTLTAPPSPTAAQPNTLTAPPSPTAAQPNTLTAQSSPRAGSAEPIPAAWSPENGTDPAGPWPAAPRPTPQYHQDQYPPQYPAQDQYPIQNQYPTQAPYPGQQYHPVQDAYRPAYADEGGSTGRSRATLIGAVVAAGVAVVAVAGLGAVVLTRDDPPPSGAAPTAAGPTAAGPTAAGPPPGDLKLRDDLTTITLTWTDPSGGAVPFMVAAGRAGQPLGVMATVDPGKTSYTVNGLNSRVDHCFTVLAVYSTDTFATSAQVCTARERTTPSSGKPSARPTAS